MEKISNENFILKLIKYVPPIFIIITSFIIIVYISSTHTNTLEKEKEKIKEDYIKLNKEEIQNNINNAANYINNKKEKTDDLLKKEIKEQVYLAHNIMTSIYNEFKDIKTKEEITQIIKSALKNIKFNNERGYYFIYDLEGVNIFHPIKPESEGKNFSNLKNINGIYTIKEAMDIAKGEKKEGYQVWMFDKPNDISKQYEKIGFIKKFETYNWFIGLGEYVEDFESKVKEEILEHIKYIGSKDRGYIFIIDNKGDFLLTRTKFSNVNDIDEKNLFSKSFYSFMNSKEENIYLDYKFINENQESSGKISYLNKVHAYDWIIGTGFNLDNLNLKIKEKQKELEKNYNEKIYITLIIAIVMTILCLIVSMIISRLFRNEFLDYKKSLEIQIEKNKIQKEALLRAQEVAHIGDWRLDLKTNKVFLSNEIIRIFGFNKEDKNKFGPELLKSIMLDEDIPYFENSISNCINTAEEYRIDYRIKRPNNEIRWIECRGKLEENKLSIIGTVQDITENKNLEIEKKQKDEILYQQNKMAAMGEMIGNIAHQWRQPLSTISTVATGMKLQKEMNSLSDNQLIPGLTLINESVQYLSSVIEDFKDFLNPSNNKISKFNISDTFNKTLNLLNAQIISNDIEIIKNIKESEISSIENELIQVLINILNNARDALISNEIQRKIIFINTYVKNSYLYIEILDNAGGIEKSILDRIFEPYFSTKHRSVGTGIGLYMGKEITEKHLNGDIFVTNEKYKFKDIDYTGAKFTIKISDILI